MNPIENASNTTDSSGRDHCESSGSGQPLLSQVSQIGECAVYSQAGHVGYFSQASQVVEADCYKQVGCSGEPLPRKAAAYPGQGLRVVHVGSLLCRAGIETWLQGLIRHVCRERIQITRCVITTNIYDPTVVAQLGVPVEIGTGAAGVRRAAANCDVMLISGPREAGQWLADCRPPLCIAVAHGEGHGTREILESCAGVLDHTIAVSPSVARTACQGFPTSVVYNGVDTRHLTHTRGRKEMRACLALRDDDFVIGYVGRFSPEKCPQALVQALALLPPCFKLLLVGWGPLYNELHYLADRVAPGRVTIASATGDLGDYYRAMDAFALVSASEGYGLAIMEAMMCRVPVMVTPVGFVPDLIVDRVNGIVLDGEPASIATAARRLAAHPDWAAGIAKEAGRTAEQHGHARQMARGYEDLLAELWHRKFG